MDNVQLTYTVETTGASSAAIAALMDAAAVPVPADILQAGGLRVTSDATPVASPVVRTIDIAFGPSVAAVLGAVVMGGNESGQFVESVPVTAPGIDYILPPQIVLSGGGAPPPSPTPNILLPAQARAFLNLQGVAGAPTGVGYSAGTIAAVLGAMAPPVYGPDGTFPDSCVQGLSIAVQGKGYDPVHSRIEFQGGLDPSNPLARPAKAVITGFGPEGEILGAQLIDPGQGYIKVPKVVVVTPGTLVSPGTSGGLSPSRPDPYTASRPNPRTTPLINKIQARIAAVMGQGTPASVALTIVAGVITAAAVVTNGARYTQVPQIFIFDPTGLGTGGLLTARMGVDSVEVFGPGKGYNSPPTATGVEFFKSLFPDTGDQRAPFWRLMQPALQKSALSPVSSSDPVLS